jgi:CRP-like cAMP-binding protein
MRFSLSEQKQSAQPDSSSAFVADPELVRALETRCTLIECSTDRVLFNQDDPATGVYILQTGAVTLTMNAKDGRRIFSVRAVPGSLLGLPALISDQPYSLTAIANTGAQVGFVGRMDFFALVEADPLLSLKMLQVLAAEVRTARQALSR